MNYDDCFKHLEDALHRANIPIQSETYLNFLGWKRRLLAVEADEKKFGVVTIDLQVQRERALRELDAIALYYADTSFLDLCHQQSTSASHTDLPMAPPPNLGNAASLAPADSTFSHAVFISYSHHDKDFVQGWLLYQLRASNISFLIDAFDFRPGAAVAAEIERALITCRKILLVLSPDYMKSEWTTFESLLAFSLDPGAQGQRVIPLLLRQCDLPPRLQYLLYLDFRQSDQWIFQLGRLLTALRA